MFHCVVTYKVAIGRVGWFVFGCKGNHFGLNCDRNEPVICFLAFLYGDFNDYTRICHQLAAARYRPRAKFAENIKNKWSFAMVVWVVFSNFACWDI